MFTAVRQKEKAKTLVSSATVNKNLLNRNIKILLEHHLILFSAVASLKDFRLRKARIETFLLVP